MSALFGIAFVTRKRSAALIGSAVGAWCCAMRRAWISLSVDEICVARSAEAERLGEMSRK
jgi:hypothetical protein